MYLYYIASTYGQNTYNSTTYNGSSSTIPAPTTTTTVADTPASNGSLLTNTGFDVALAVGLAALIIFVALVVRFWKRPAANV